MGERLAFCRLQRRMHPEQAYIDPSVRIPQWVRIGHNVTIREGCFLGTQGFGFEPDEDGNLLHIPHSGILIIEDNVEIFEGTQIARGTVDATVIGSGTKIDVLCHIAHNVHIGRRCSIAGGSCIGGSAIIGNDVFIGTGTTIKDHVHIADRVFIGCGSNVVKDITRPNSICAGNPARFLRDRSE